MSAAEGFMFLLYRVELTFFPETCLATLVTFRMLMIIMRCLLVRYSHW